MRRKLGDLIWGQSTNGNSVGQILAQLKRDIALLRSRPVKVAALEEISPDLGTITSGRFIASSDSDPLTIIDSDTEGNAPTVAGSGVVIDGDGIPVSDGGDKGNVIGYNSATPTVWMSAADGKLYRGAGAIVSDMNGETFYIGEVGGAYINFERPGYSSPSAGSLGLSPNMLSLNHVGAGNAELLANADFETGTLTNWTAAGAGTWSADTTTVYRGAKSAKCVLSGTSAHTLTSDRVVIGSETDVKLLIIYQYSTLVGWTNKRVDIKWYDSAVGGSLVQTDTVDLGNAAANTWLYKILTAHAPTAASYEVVLSVTTGSGTPSIYFDGLRLRDMSVGSGTIEIRDTIRGALNGTVSSTGAPDTADAAQGRAVNPYWNMANQVSGLHYGDYAGYKVQASSTSEVTVYSRNIKQGVIGDYGTMRYVVSGLQINTSAGNRTFRHRIYLGATTLFDFTITVTTTQDYRPFDIVLNITNRALWNAQMCRGYIIEGANAGGDSSGLGSAPNINMLLNSAALDMESSDQVFKHTITMDSSASTVSWQRASAYMDGPNPARS